MFTLVMNPGLAAEESFPLAMGTVTIGRTSDNQITCMHKSLSRKHAQVDVDSSTLRVADLQSKNGLFFNGRRVATCELVEGDTFRCGDITFLVEGATLRGRRSASVKTLPSPLAREDLRGTAPLKATPVAVAGRDSRHLDKLLLLVRASEVLVGEMPVDRMLDALLALAAKVLVVDRLVLLTLHEKTLELEPRVIKTATHAAAHAYSKRVVDWVVDHGPASFADASADPKLPISTEQDAVVRSAMAAPLNPGGGIIGVLYADHAKVDTFGPDDLATLRGLANMAAMAMFAHALRLPPGGASALHATKLSG